MTSSRITTTVAALATLAATAVPCVAVAATPRSTTSTQAFTHTDHGPCGTIASHKTAFKAAITHGTFDCRQAKAVLHDYFHKVDPLAAPNRKITVIHRAGTRFRCQAASTGHIDWLCFGPKDTPILGATQIRR